MNEGDRTMLQRVIERWKMLSVQQRLKVLWTVWLTGWMAYFAYNLFTGLDVMVASAQAMTVAELAELAVFTAWAVAGIIGVLVFRWLNQVVLSAIDLYSARLGESDE